MCAERATEEDASTVTTPERSTPLGEDKAQAKFLAYLRSLYNHVPERRRERHEVDE